MEFQQYVSVVKRRIWLILLMMLFASGGAAAYTLVKTTTYQSTSTLLLNPAVPSELIPYLQVQAASSLADSYGEYMRSEAFAALVSKELGYSLDAEELKAILSTRLVPNTMFFKISAQSSDPAQAQAIASTATRIFISSNNGQQVNQKQVDDNSKLRDNLQADLDYYSKEEQSYIGQINALDSQTQSQQRDAQISTLRSQLLQVQSAKADTLKAMTQLTPTANQQPNAIVVDDALPALPMSNHTIELTLLAMLAALILGIALALGLEYVDYTIHSPEQMDELLKIPAMGVIAEFKGAARGRRGERDKKSKQTLITLSQPHSPFSEAYRTIRTNLQFSGVDSPLRVVLVTSAAPGEGKSVTAANLAVVMAQAGNRVVLIDADLRRPSQHRLFGLENSTGLTNLILNPSSAPAELVHSIPDVPNLSVITSGPLPPNPAELLNSRYTERIIALMRNRTDVVIIDSPPAIAVTDSLVLARYADAAVLVVQAGRTRRDIAQKLCASLATAGVRVVAPVLNRTSSGDLKGYYYDYYGSGSQGATITQNLLVSPVNLNGTQSDADHEAVVLRQAQVSHRRTSHLRPGMVGHNNRRGS